MHTCTSKYTPPVPVEGTVTLTMPECTARKLRALLRCCNGDVFDDLEHALTELNLMPVTLLVKGEGAPPASTYLSQGGEQLVINLHAGLVFKEGDHE